MLILLFLFAGCFSEGVKMSDLKVIKFEAAWCGPCKLVKPVFSKVSADEPEVLFETVDVDKDSETAIQMNIMSVPTLVFVKNGKVVDKVVGVFAESELRELVSKWK